MRWRWARVSEDVGVGADRPRVGGVRRWIIGRSGTAKPARRRDVGRTAVVGAGSTASTVGGVAGTAAIGSPCGHGDTHQPTPIATAKAAAAGTTSHPAQGAPRPDGRADHEASRARRPRSL
ncbi:MAG: hypothetical protein AAF586_06710, partial [Planctomycetota bacterium]